MSFSPLSPHLSFPLLPIPRIPEQYMRYSLVNTKDSEKNKQAKDFYHFRKKTTKIRMYIHREAGNENALGMIYHKINHSEELGDQAKSIDRK